MLTNIWFHQLNWPTVYPQYSLGLYAVINQSIHIVGNQLAAEESSVGLDGYVYAFIGAVFVVAYVVKLQ